MLSSTWIVIILKISGLSMGKISEFTQQDYQVIARNYADLKEAARKRCADVNEIEVVQKAFDFANQAHKGVRRRSGEPYILHPIAVAKIVVSNIGLGYKSIVAALLHDVVEDTDYTVDDIRNLFGDKVASLVDGLTKIKTVLDNEDKAQQKSIQAENFKRILLTLNDDVRVVLIKLADRLHNCRTIEYMPEHKRDKILSETMFIFIPQSIATTWYFCVSVSEIIILSQLTRDTASVGMSVDFSFAMPSSKGVKISVISTLREPKSRIERFSFLVSMPYIPGMPNFSITSDKVAVLLKLEGSSLYSRTISAPRVGVSRS